MLIYETENGEPRCQDTVGRLPDITINKTSPAAPTQVINHRPDTWPGSVSDSCPHSQECCRSWGAPHLRSSDSYTHSDRFHQKQGHQAADGRVRGSGKPRSQRARPCRSCAGQGGGCAHGLPACKPRPPSVSRARLTTSLKGRISRFSDVGLATTQGLSFKPKEPW